MANKCGCWAALKREVKGACSSSSSTDSPNTIPRTSLVYGAATETRYLNASNKELAVPQDAQASTDVVIDPPGPKKKDAP